MGPCVETTKRVQWVLERRSRKVVHRARAGALRRSYDAFMVCVVVERDLPPTTVADAQQQQARVDQALRASGIAKLQSYAANDWSKLTCVYATEDVDAVQREYEAAGLRSVRVWIARELLE